MTRQYIDVLFDGAPGAVSGRFIETESPANVGVGGAGLTWIDRCDGYWALRVTPDAFKVPPVRQQTVPSTAQANILLYVLRTRADDQDALTIHGVYDTAPDHVADILMLNEDEIFYNDNLGKFVAAAEPEYTIQHYLDDQAEAANDAERCGEWL